MEFNATTLMWAVAGGILPALFWLWFWLKEDEHPEPHKLIAYAFLGGMAVVPIAGFLQVYLRDHHILQEGTVIFWLAFAGIEEILKLIAALCTTLFRKEDDEPLDPGIYLLATALGFASLENVLFVIDPIHNGNITLSILTGNVRFIGATLLHLLTSVTIGVLIGLVFYKSWFRKSLNAIIGLLIATLLHGVFNLLIIENNPYTTLSAFFSVWIAIMILALFFEKLKNTKP